MNYMYAIIHSQCKRRKGAVLTKEKDSVDQGKVLDQIINNATGLPPDNLEVILLIAKSMKYTRERMMKECNKE